MRADSIRIIAFSTCVLAGLSLSACGSAPSQYSLTLADADAAARSRRPEEAARLYQKAAGEAEKEDLAVEAAYREASMWRRQGQPERALACLERLARENETSSRGQRIWLDLGRLRHALGDEAGARQAYLEVLAYPDTGLATRAADALVELSPSPRSSAYRGLLGEGAASPDLDAFLRLRVAQAEVAEGALTAAIATCESLIRAHPLPRGVYTDDALLLAASLRRQLGDPAGALLTIDALVAAQEKSAVVGSYERLAFAEARWLAADIHQLDRADPKSAFGVLDDLVRLDPNSRLRDDALYRAAWIAAHELEDQRLACDRARQLEGLEPPSSLAECLGEVCPALNRAAGPSRRCDRALTAARGTSRPDHQ